jgi:hypothetical protein
MHHRFFPQLMLGLLALAQGAAWADEPIVPGDGFAASRYESLWTKSPFSVATPDGPAESADYAMVGVAQFDGVSYASLIDKQTNEHFLVSSDKPARGLVLVSVARGHDSSDMSAVIQNGPKTISLKLEQAPAMGIPPGMTATGPSPQVPVPGVMVPVNRTQMPPPAMSHPRVILLPPPPPR